MFHATGMPGWMRFGHGVSHPWREPAPDAERRFLEEQTEVLKGQLENIEQRLDELAGRDQEKS